MSPTERQPSPVGVLHFSLRLGMKLGVPLIDTAEMYAEGRAEEIVGEEIASRV